MEVTTPPAGSVGYGSPVITPNGQLLVGRKDNYTFLDSSYVTPQMFGAKADGIEDDSTAIQSAVNSNFPVYLVGTYLIGGTINVPTSSYIRGFSAVVKTSSNSAIFTITGPSTTICDIVFEGSSAGTSQHGIRMNGVSNLSVYRGANIVSGCRFVNLGGAGIYSQYMVGSENGSKHEGGFQVSDCIAEGCNIGFHLDVRAEYNKFSNCKAFKCQTGTIIAGGNNSWSGGDLSDNVVGVSLVTGTNDGHSVMSGVSINHNTTSIHSEGVQNGYLFIGCMVYAGDITLNNSNRIGFLGCDFSTLSLRVLTCTNTHFINNRVITDLPLIDFSGSSNSIVWDGNIFITGTVPSQIEYVANSGRRVLNGAIYNSNRNLSADHIIQTYGGVGLGAHMRFQKAASPTTKTADNDAIGGPIWMGNDGTGWTNFATIAGQVDGSVSTGVIPGLLAFKTRGVSDDSAVERMRINAAGRVIVGSTSDNGYLLQVAGTMTANRYKVNAMDTAPASATAAGVTGETRVTADYIYVCVATNTWKRVSLTTW